MIPLMLCSPFAPVGAAYEIYVHLEEGFPFYFTFLCHSHVCLYILKDFDFFYFVVSSRSWNLICT